MQTCACKHIRTRLRVRAYTHTHTHTHTHTQCVRRSVTNIDAFWKSHMHTRGACARTHAYRHARSHTYTHTNKHTHTYTHMLTKSLASTHRDDTEKQCEPYARCLVNGVMGTTLFIGGSRYNSCNKQ